MVQNNSDRNKILNGFVWKFAERISSQGASFVLSVILARLLMPEEYGLVAMINVFIVLANVFVTSGFSSSLIQNKDADDLDFSTIFYCTLTTSILIYGIIYVVSPYIADFYNMPALCSLLRVYALLLIITSYQTIQQAYISRHMLFKKTFVPTFIGTLLSGVIGVVMAYNGFGVWSLVVQSISNIFINMLMLMKIIPWHPKLFFSWTRAKVLMSYGSKILAGSLISAIYKEIRQFIIGKMYSPVDLGLYNRGNNLPSLINTNMDITIRSVLFPAMSNYSDNPERVKQILRRGIKTSSYISFFFLTLMAATAEPLVKILLTEKWINCVPYMQVFCISYMFLGIAGYNVEAIKAIGKSKEVLKLEVFKKPVFLIVILIAAQFSVFAVVLTSPFNSFYAMAMNMKPTKQCLNYNLKEQIDDLLPATLLAIALAITTLPLTLLEWNDFVILGLQIVIGICVYVSLSQVFKVASYAYVKSTIMDIYNKKIERRR